MPTHSRAAIAIGHAGGVVAQAVLVAAIIALAALAMSPLLHPAASFGGVQQAQAGSTSWIALRSATSAAATGPALGSTVAFDAGYPKTVKNARVAVKCYQDGVLVYAEARNVDESLQLGGGSSDWLRSGGPAACEADLFYFTYKGRVQSYHWLASTSFDAAG